MKASLPSSFLTVFIIAVVPTVIGNTIDVTLEQQHQNGAPPVANYDLQAIVPYEQGGLLVENAQTKKKTTIGVQQIKPKTEEGQINVEFNDRLQKFQDGTISYLRETILGDPTKYTMYAGQCKNHHELCTFWAMANDCQENPIFMIKNCPLACQQCEKAASFSDFSADEEEEEEQVNVVQRQAETDPEKVLYENGGLLVENKDTKKKTTIGVQQKIKNLKTSEGHINKEFNDKLQKYENNIIYSYLRDVILANPTDKCNYDEFIDKCTNNHELCTLWSMNGDCETNRYYMIDQGQCLLACKRCQENSCASTTTTSTTPPQTQAQATTSPIATVEEGGGKTIHSRAALETILYEDGGLLVQNVNTRKKAKIGVPQINPTSDEKLIGPLGKIEQDMVVYLRETILADSISSLVPADCKNHHENCVYWAFKGECATNQKYMIDDGNCALACKQCEL